MTKATHPLKLPATLDYSLFAKELARASYELGELNGLQRDLPNPTLLISPLTTKEATVSSKIEGTRSTVKDVMVYEAGAGARYDDTVEVSNYKMAMIWATKSLKARQLNNSFIKELHSLLLQNARGHEKRGEFRKEQVYIGKEGDPIKKASYVPPEHYLIPDYMDNLEAFMQGNNEDLLVKSAVIHYQFEAIHPFLDGNGRIGRLIIPLYLYQKGRLIQPILYLSGFFERNRDAYIGSLQIVDKTKKYEAWIRFFLQAVESQSKETKDLITKINKLKDEVMQKGELLKSPYTYKAINFFFTKPVFRRVDFVKDIKAQSRMTGLRLINRFKELGVIQEFTPRMPEGKRKRLFIFSDLLALL